MIGSPSSGLVELMVWDIYTLLIGVYLEGERVDVKADVKAVADILFWGFPKKP